jgi:hypothetical protein
VVEAGALAGGHSTRFVAGRFFATALDAVGSPLFARDGASLTSKSGNTNNDTSKSSNSQ